MKKLNKFISFLLFFFVFCAVFAKDTIYWVPQFSEFKEINENDLFFLKKTLKNAEKNKVKAIKLLKKIDIFIEKNCKIS